MPKSSGNQWGENDYPSDNELRPAFNQYAKENNGSGLTADQQMARLEQEFGLCIKRSKLYELRKRLEIKSVRKNEVTPIQDTIQLVVDIKADDFAGKWGVAQVRQRLANTGILLKRDDLRQILHDHFEPEFNQRLCFSRRNTIKRVPLDCLGPWHQLHSDGHEKLAEQALRMGHGLSLPIYAFKDEFSSFVPYLRVLPDVRTSRAIGHAFLDFVELYECIPIQLTTDKGSEISDMVHCHKTLRLHAAPDFVIDKWPTAVQVQSKHNTPIESFWRWKRQGEGHSIKEVLFAGKAAGVLNSNNWLHVQIFKWLWPPLVQQRLDEFREYWNNHALKRQKEKLLPSGMSPRHVWLVPESARANARDCSITVSCDLIKQLREELGGIEGRDEVLKFVDDEFQAQADDALAQLGFPLISLTNAWDIFTAVLEIMSL